MIAAAIEVKAGRFKYHVGEDKDHFFAWRDARPDEDSLTGHVGVKQDDVKKLREQGVEVFCQPALKSCSNCSNCYRLFESDSDEGLDVPGLRSRPVMELTMDGTYSPRLLCTNKLQIMDIDAADYVNELSRIDNSGYTNRKGWRRKVGDNQVVVNRFRYGTEKLLVSQRWEGDEESGEPVKEFVSEEYEGSEDVVVSFDDLVALRLESEADECPMWTRVERDYAYYEWAKVDKCAILGLNKDGHWELLTKDKDVKKAGKNWKFAIRYHGIELSYVKKTVLEKQLDFLNELDKGLDTSKLDEILAKFENEKPEPFVRDRWLVAGNSVAVAVWPEKEDDPLRERLSGILVNLASL
jgi:hypothetical protein